MEGRGQRPTAEEVISKLKDDGDFDNLRLKIIRKVKENEELRNSITAEVKESAILNQDGSENLKPRQLSDAIYQELGKKIMGQISDEVWKVIRNDNIKDDIRGTVESVYNRILNPKEKEECPQSSPSKENSINEKQISVSPVKFSSIDANMCDESEPQEPPGFATCGQLANGANKVDCKESQHDQPLCLPSEDKQHCQVNIVDDDMPPGFGKPVSGAAASAVAVSPGFNTPSGAGAAAVPPGIDAGGDGVDVPPGFDLGGGGVSPMPPGFGTVGTGGGGSRMPPGFGTGGEVMPPGFNTWDAGVEDDDPDVPPGFG